MGFRSFFGLAPCGFYWELAIQISNGMKAQEIPHLELRKSLLGKKSNVEVAPTVSQVIEEAKRKLEEGKPKRKTFHDPMLVKAFDQEMAAKARSTRLFMFLNTYDLLRCLGRSLIEKRSTNVATKPQQIRPIYISWTDLKAGMAATCILQRS